MSDEADKQLILKLLKEHPGEALDVNYIAKETGLSWFKVYRILSEIVFLEISQKHTHLINDLSVFPEMTTKGLIFRPQRAKEVA
jgi:hypothetical protein